MRDSRRRPRARLALRRIIDVPAQAAGLHFDPGIVDDLIKEVSGEPTALAMLQFTLIQLWERRDRDRVTADVYRMVGRPREALTRTAEAVYASLSPDEQVTAKSIFAELAQPTLGEASLRRRPRRDRLLQLGEPATVRRVLEAFVGARLIRMTPGQNDDDDRFEVAHEALIDDWPRLQEWQRAEGQKSEKKLQLIAAARLWLKSGQKVGYLLTDEAALAEASQYRDAAPEIRDFVAASELFVRQKTRAQMGIWSAAAVIATFAAAALLFLWQAEHRAREDADEALAQAKAFQSLRDDAAKGAIVSLEQRMQLVADQQATIDKLQREVAELKARLGEKSEISDVITNEAPTTFKGDKDNITTLSSFEGFVWIGSDAISNIDGGIPSQAKKGTRYKLTKNSVLRDAWPTDPGYVQGKSSRNHARRYDGDREG